MSVGVTTDQKQNKQYFKMIPNWVESIFTKLL